MNKIIFIIAILNLLLNTSCFLSRATPQVGLIDREHLERLDIPDWYFQYENPGFIHGTGSSRKVGTDEGKCQAITSALFSIAQKLYHTKRYSTHNDNLFYFDEINNQFVYDFSQVSSKAFGNVNLYGETKEHVVEEGDGMDATVNGIFESMLKLSYVKDNKSLIFVDYYEEIGLDLDAEIIRKSYFIKQEFSIDELLKELKDYGFRYEFDNRKEEIFLLLEMNRELLLNKQNIDDVSSDIKLEAAKAQKKLQEDLIKYNLKRSNN